MYIKPEVKKYYYEDRVGNLKAEAQGIVKSEKHFPIFEEDGKLLVFKPLSKTKPLLTPLFALSEVYWSNIINQHFDENTPVYTLAECIGISDDIPKYYEKGTIVAKIEKEGERLVNLLELFRLYPDEKVDIEKYENYCGVFYDYTKILESDFFKSHPKLAEDLAFQILLSILKGDINYHYENVSLIFKDDKPISLAPSIDHEFSTFFTNLDILSEYFKYHEKILSAINFENIPLDVQNTINIEKNLNYIVDNYPDTVRKFISCLDSLKKDIRYNGVRFINNGFVEPFNSLDYLIGIARYKNHDEPLAKRYEKSILKNEINLINFSKKLNKNVLEMIDELTVNLSKKLTKKDSKILTKQNI